MVKNLVLLSGLLSNEMLWHHQAKALAPVASISIISSIDDSPEKMIKAILEKAPPRFALAGHSMGGWLALEVMRKAGERVERLCLLNTTARADSSEKRERRRQMIELVKRGEFAQVVDSLVDLLVHKPEAKDEVRQMFLAVGPAVFIAQEEAMLKRQETESILETITCPTLIIHAAEDKNFSAKEHEELEKGIRGSTLAIVKESGHMSPLEAPQDVARLMRSWLSD